MPDVEIRQARQEDRGAVLSLAMRLATSFQVEQEAFLRSWDAALAQADAAVLVAETDDGVSGYLLGFLHPAFFANGPVGWVEELMVDDPRRRQGIGRQLMQAFEDWARDSGCALVALATRRAQEFYRAIGYEESAAYFRKLL